MSPLARLADFTFRRRRRVVLTWIAAFAAILAIGPSLAGEYEADFSSPGTESAIAAGLLQERFPGTSDETIDVVWEAPGGVAAHQAQMERFLVQAAGLEGVGDPQRVRVSSDGTIALASLELDRRSWDVPMETGERIIDMAEEQRGDGLRIELGGGPIMNAQESASPEMASLLAAALILLIAFGSIVAAGLPIVTALFGLGISMSLIGVLTALMDVPDFAPAIASLMGIGVGIDYALLVLTRFRAALEHGADRREAVIEAVTTAGRSVLVAGTTVVIALLGLFAMGASYMRGVAVSASLSVLVVMAAAVTLLPALLAMLGPRVNRLRLPGMGRATAHPERPGLAGRWSAAVQRRPWTAAIAGAAVLIALTAPVLGLRLGFPDAGNDREGTTTRAAYDLAAQGFGQGANGPLLVVADLRGGNRSAVDRAVARLRELPGVANVSPARLNPARDTAMIAVEPTTSPQDQATEELVHRMREALGATGADVYVGGITAAFVDQSEQISSRLPVFIGAVVGLSFLLLLAAFRAPVIALKAGVMNLLSVGAAYGVVALVAEGGALGSALGIAADTPVPPFIPVIMFAILFGLSMDYEVFLLSRVREEFLRHGNTARAVTEGVAKTARVITAAAAIMVAVFMAFVLNPEAFLKLMGIGMATAIFVDATIVRMVLVPAVMQLMGRGNWWIPRWLDRLLPRVSVERPEPAAEAA